VLFRHVERREIETLFTRVRIRDFAAGETIFGIGSPADSMMIVLRGTVQTRVTLPEDRPILLPGTVQTRVTLPEDRPILLPGTVQTSVTSPGGQPLRNTLSPGAIFGEIALSEGGARLADAIAFTDCSLAIIDYEAVPVGAKDRIRRRFSTGTNPTATQLIGEACI
jgi:CRP-like cAMP-binding protein